MLNISSIFAKTEQTWLQYDHDHDHDHSRIHRYTAISSYKFPCPTILPLTPTAILNAQYPTLSPLLPNPFPPPSPTSSYTPQNLSTTLPLSILLLNPLLIQLIRRPSGLRRRLGDPGLRLFGRRTAVRGTGGRVHGAGDVGRYR